VRRPGARPAGGRHLDEAGAFAPYKIIPIANRIVFCGCDVSDESIVNVF
jgi:hypothetical protein